MNEADVRSVLSKSLNFSSENIDKFNKFHEILLESNKKHNFIAKSTVPLIWHRHFLSEKGLEKRKKSNKCKTKTTNYVFYNRFDAFATFFMLFHIYFSFYNIDK